MSKAAASVMDCSSFKLARSPRRSTVPQSFALHVSVSLFAHLAFVVVDWNDWCVNCSKP